MQYLSQAVAYWEEAVMKQTFHDDSSLPANTVSFIEDCFVDLVQFLQYNGTSVFNHNSFLQSVKD